MRYLLDTHAVIWLLSSEDKKLPNIIRESILYCEDSFFLSEISLIEIIQLQQKERIAFNYRPNTTRAIIEENNIVILPPSGDILESFFNLPLPSINGKLHSDPFDRIIISTAIRRDLTIVSADSKFPWYKKHCGLNLLEIWVMPPFPKASLKSVVNVQKKHTYDRFHAYFLWWKNGENGGKAVEKKFSTTGIFCGKKCIFAIQNIF